MSVCQYVYLSAFLSVCFSLIESVMLPLFNGHAVQTYNFRSLFECYHLIATFIPRDKKKFDSRPKQSQGVKSWTYCCLSDVMANFFLDVYI